MYSIKIIKEQIKKAKTIAIFGHKNPDADCLAAMVSLKRVIKNKMGNMIVDLFCEGCEFGEMYDPIIKDEVFLKNAGSEPYDLAICVDCPNSSRMGIHETAFLNAKTTMNVDHHENSENFADYNYLYKCSSTCEIVYVLLKAMSIDVSNDILKMLYAGIVTDTMNLTQGTLKVSSYKIIAEIVEKVHDMAALEAIKDHFLKNKTKSNALLLERALRSMNFYLDDKVAIMKITKHDILDAEAQQSDTLGIVNHAINLKGVYIAILLIMQENGSYYVSLRGKNNIDVASVAEAFGGGGHDAVAAFQYDEKLSDLKEKLLNLCQNAINEEDDEESGINLFE